MKTLTYIGFILLVACVSISCRKDFDFETINTPLSFSRDTVYLDTVFTNTKSATYTLKAYNSSNKNVKIPKIRLAQGEQSGYRLLIDGISGKDFDNIEILARDSVYIFIETAVDFDKTQDKSYLYTDQIQFIGGQKTQNVELVTLVKDAYFLYPQKDKNGKTEQIQITDNLKAEGFWLTENHPTAGNILHLTNKKPYVIYGFAAVPENAKLIIDEGTELYFHNNSGLIAQKNSSIEANGSLEKPIIFTGNRLEYTYRYLPGQWKGIWLRNTAESSLQNVLISNADIGLIAENTDYLSLYNVQIYNSAQYGLLGINAQIDGKNIVAADAGLASVALKEGGKYNFTHASFANFWNVVNQTSLWIENSSDADLGSYTFQNCLIYSSTSSSFVIQSDEAKIEKLAFKNNLLKDFSSRAQTNSFPYNYQDENYYNNNIILKNSKDGKPVFANINQNKYQLTDQSTEILGKADAETAKSVPEDLSGKSRLLQTDFGAYQHINTVQE